MNGLPAETLHDEISRLNNELTDQQRALARRNAELRALNERINLLLSTAGSDERAVPAGGEPLDPASERREPGPAKLIPEHQLLRLAKLHRPRVTGDLVRRSRLREILNRSVDRPLTLVCAPAGYGKTMLLADWLERSDHPSAWLSLDEGDSDPAVFLSYLIAALRIPFPAACADTRALLRAPQLPPLSFLAATLANDLDRLTQPPTSQDDPARPRPRCIVVLDDYHLMGGQAVSGLLTELLRHPPRSVHLILSTRQDPPLPLNTLRARGELGEIRMQELRFNVEEVAAFMEKRLESPLSEEVVALLEERTEGWAAGLRLAALTLSTSGDIDAEVADLPALGDHRYVMDYLISEVLSHVPAPTQSFLLKTSILDRLTGSLCDEVTGLVDPVWDGQAYLEWLEQENLFTFSLDAPRQWYRYHHLFQTLLRNRLQRQHRPDEIAGLHARASAWFAGHGLVEEAIFHALAAGDETAAVRQIEAHRHEAMNEEQWQQLERWLGLFPQRSIDSRPELAMLEAWVLENRFRLGEALPCLARVEALTEQTPLAGEASHFEVTAKRWQGEMDTLRGELSYWAADAERGAAHARRALEAVPLEHSCVRGHAWVSLAGALQMKGDLASALATLYDGLREDRFHGNTFATRLLLGLANIRWISADLSDAAEAANHLLLLARERGLQESVTRGHYCLGSIHYQRNDLVAAESAFAAVLEQRDVAFPLIFTQSALGLASVYQAQGLAGRARETVELAAAYALEMNNPAILADAQAFAAHLALSQGRKAEALRWAAQYDRDIRPAPMPAFYAAPFTLAEVLLAEATPESLQEASQVLTRLHDLTVTTHNTRFLIEALALQALLYDARQDQAAALAALEEAITLAQPGGLIRVFVDLGPRLAALLCQLSARGVAPEYLTRLLTAFPEVTQQGNPSQAGLIEPLSERELEVLVLLAERLSNKEIARELDISALTVKSHTINIYQKLQVGSRREAVARAMALGLVSPSTSRYLGPPVPR